ncbi:outer membrane protein TolC precursor [bacterium BMS3Abin05]|nr:outer membrane protein TolC precursor [bacterium BMS3Abin05]
MTAFFKKYTLLGFFIIFTASAAGAQETLHLNVQSSLQIAFKKNNNLKIAKAKLDETAARLNQAGTAFFPKLSSQANYTRLDYAPFIPLKSFSHIFPGGGAPGGLSGGITPKKITIGRNQNYGLSISLQQPLFTGMKILNGYSIAKHSKYAAEQNCRATKNTLIFNVEQAYWTVIKAQKFEEIARESIKQMEAHVKDLQNMYHVGMLTKNELLKAEVQLSNVHLLEIKAKNAVQLSRIAFCNVLGLPLDTKITFDDSLKFIPLPFKSVREAVALAKKNRPDLRMMEENVIIGKKMVDMSKASYLPTVAFVANYGYKYPDREYNPTFYNTWTVSVVAQMNLFDWGDTYFKKQQSESQLRQIQITQKMLRDGVVLEVTESFLAAKQAQEKIRVSEKTVAQAKENFRVTSDKFKEGMATNTDFLDANALLTKARNDYISALADYRIASAKLLKAVGEPGKSR